MKEESIITTENKVNMESMIQTIQPQQVYLQNMDC